MPILSDGTRGQYQQEPAEGVSAPYDIKCCFCLFFYLHNCSQESSLSTLDMYRSVGNKKSIERKAIIFSLHYRTAAEFKWNQSLVYMLLCGYISLSLAVILFIPCIYVTAASSRNCHSQSLSMLRPIPRGKKNIHNCNNLCVLPKKGTAYCLRGWVRRYSAKHAEKSRLFGMRITRSLDRELLK